MASLANTRGVCGVFSWLTEDDMSEDLYTPYESEGEESLEAAGLDGSSDAHRLPGRENGGSELSSDDGRRRRTDFKDIRDSPRTRSLSKERGWYDGTGTIRANSVA